MLHVLQMALAAALAAPQSAATGPITVPRTPAPIVVDEEPSPSRGLIVSDFRQRDPNDGEPSTQTTAAWVSYDARNLYVLFRCRDREPALLRAHLSKRDQITQDDQVIVMIDTFRDRQRAYLFAANALGVQADASLAEGREDDYSFDTVWRTEGRRTADGFAVLMTIPFKSLRVAPDPNAPWGLALSRVIPRNSEQAFWPYITRHVEGTMQQFAPVRLPERSAGDRNFQVIPYAAGDTGRYLDATAARFGNASNLRAGADLKVVVGGTTAIDAAINPDFSQVESDQPQIAVNQRFELFYPEKRPFFLENAASFRYPAVPPSRTLSDMLFFSRRIVDPRAGVRITGKAASWSFGGVVAQDRAGIADSLTTVARIQREFADQSSVGAMATSRDNSLEGNQVGALDGRWKLSPNLALLGQASASSSRGATNAARGGHALNAALIYSSRRTLATLFYSDRSPRFRAALGFVPRVDMRQIEHYGEYRWHPRRGPIVAIGPNSYLRWNWSYDGTLQEWIIRVPFQVDMKARTSVFVRRVESQEVFMGIPLRERFQTINVSTEPLKWLALTESVEWGKTPNFVPAAGLAPHVAESLNASFGITLRPTPRLRYEQSVLYSGLRDPDAAIFSNGIARSTVNYQATRAWGARTIVDYSAVLPNEARAALSRDVHVAVDTLLTYQPGPSTAVYIGYTSAYQNVAIGPEDATLVRTDRPDTPIGRRVFVKASYLWRR